MSGHAGAGGGRIVVTIAPDCGREWVEAIVVHEAAHAALPAGVHHDEAWRSAYLRAVRELHAIDGVTLGSQAAWKLDEQIARAIRTARTAECHQQDAA